MIGMFDSGSGGLSVLFEIRKLMPSADIVYLGDIANAPYGGKTKEQLGALTSAAVSRLLSEGATKIVSACNSVSASIVLPMLSILSVKPFDIIEMVGPTVKSLRYEKNKILLVATSATIKSKIYQQGFKSVGIKIDTLELPELAGAIEFGKSDLEIEKIIKCYFNGKKFDFKILLLGCTHYPLVKDFFEKILKKNNSVATIYDPATAVANEVYKTMNEKGHGTTRFLITKDSRVFRTRVKHLFGTKKVKVDLI